MGSLSSYGGKLSSLDGLLSSNGGRLSNFGSGAPTPITTDFSYAQFEGGQAGIIDTSRSATRTYWGASRTVWVGTITGTEALLTVDRSSGSVDGSTITVSVDGGNFANAPLSGGRCVLFSGLSDAPHKIAIKVGDGYGTSVRVQNSGTVLSVTGVTPAIDTPTQQLKMFDGNALYDTHSKKSALSGGYLTYSPLNIASGEPKYSAGQRFKTDATKLWVASAHRYVYVSVDGAAPTRYDRGVTPTLNFHIIDLDGAQHTYNVWVKDDPVTANVGMLSVGVNGTVYDVGAKLRLNQFGDSITQGVGATSTGEVDTHGVAAHFGMLGTTYGVSGENTAGLKARLPSLLTNLAPSSTDVAVLAIGRNDDLTTVGPTFEADYQDVVNMLIAVYGKVLCRGVLPEATTWPVGNGKIQALVAAMANPNVVFIDTSTWTGIDKSDGTHPSDAGYDTLETYCKTAYAPYLS
jgi:lysophospholipase L1-like esterase